MNAQPGLCRWCMLHVLSQVFSQHAPPFMSKCIYCYKCVSDKKSEI